MLGILFGDLVDCGACISRPHNIFGRVRSMEVKPPILDGTPALAEERGKLVDPGRECLMRGGQLFPGRVLIMFIELLCYDNPA